MAMETMHDAVEKLIACTHIIITQWNLRITDTLEGAIIINSAVLICMSFIERLSSSRRFPILLYIGKVIFLGPWACSVCPL